LDVLAVYRKILEIKNARKGDEKPISVNEIAQQFDGRNELVEEYINALTILELIEPMDNE